MKLGRHLSRRKLLTAAGIGAALVGVDALGIEPRWLQVTRHDVPIPSLPSALEGFVIAQITDAHLTALGQLETQLLAELRRASPQLVVLTGDLIDDSSQFGLLAELCAEIAKLGTRVVATLGNWEHWGHLPRAKLARTYAKASAQLLVDEWHPYDRSLSLYATDDSTGGHPAPLSPRPHAEAIALLLTHSPAFVDEHPPPGERSFDLCLAGHTHGGQINAGPFAPVVPPGSGRFVAGWYDTQLGPLYVSKGTGTSLVPARFCCRPELPLFRLRRA
ncbi:Ser/Thr protein phosphatase family protein [Enhygromyxa salina]|uniref:Ser/Thr protein phosphatase family protein n=1 Tax=Enhygromyxa salina TaxID=215803 RepID=A0A0C1ZWN5_9BACT|nr:metallophosphoesterase [Enhygromyxa salina]KIG15468.1 Ser/Thr protein phosphatase family protein [Enhygromyxa salina]